MSCFVCWLVDIKHMKEKLTSTYKNASLGWQQKVAHQLCFEWRLASAFPWFCLLPVHTQFTHTHTYRQWKTRAQVLFKPIDTAGKIHSSSSFPFCSCKNTGKNLKAQSTAWKLNFLSCTEERQFSFVQLSSFSSNFTSNFYCRSIYFNDSASFFNFLTEAEEEVAEKGF